jgi:glycosyltransferase involved in cell wall biosynthesis
MPSNLLAGVLIKKLYKSKLLFDIGDPWTYCPNDKAFRWRRKLNKYAEEVLLKQADHIIVNTKELQKLYVDKLEVENRKIRCIYSGADKVSEVSEVGQPPQNDKFKILYTGVFHDKIREPYNFFKAISKLDNDMNLSIKIAGNIYSWFIDYYKKLNSKLEIEFLGLLDHEKVVEMQNKADLLLFFSNKSEYQLPSKIFEYLSTDNPILHMISIMILFWRNLQVNKGSFGLKMKPTRLSKS